MLLTLRQRFAFFICIAIIGFLISSLFGSFLIGKYPDSTAAMRIAAVVQSIFQLIIPSLATAIIVTRQPVKFLAIDKSISLPMTLLALAGLVVSIPALNYIISLNQSLVLPDSLSWLEDLMKGMEDNAARSISLLQGGHSIGNLVMNILIIGVMAGFGEELFFRGTMMRLMTTGGVNAHVAIWTTAIIFSAMHLQFYGFVPRMVLGTYFGYLLYWSRNLWIPIIIHAANNIIYVYFQWAFHTRETSPIDSIGSKGDLPVIALSVAATTVILWLIYRVRGDFSARPAEH